MNPLVYFVAVILKVLVVNLLAALNFAVFLIKKNVWKIKNVKERKKRDQNKKNVKRFYMYDLNLVTDRFKCHSACISCL